MVLVASAPVAAAARGCCRSAPHVRSTRWSTTVRVRSTRVPRFQPSSPTRCNPSPPAGVAGWVKPTPHPFPHPSVVVVRSVSAHASPHADPSSHATFTPGTDQLLLDIADYVVGYEVKSKDAVKTARYAILDAVGCALLALNFPECTKLLGPVVPGVSVRCGAHVLGTAYDVDPVTAAQNLSTAIRWLDYNDAWLVGRPRETK